MEVNIFPKFLDKALSSPAEAVGNTLSSVWQIVFGGIDSYSDRVNYKRTFNNEQFRKSLEEKIMTIPDENIVEPPLHVLGPALEASKFYFENEQLRDMFAQLIASSINSDTADFVHPAFIEIIKQLSPDEAKILKYIKTDFFPLLSIFFKTGQTFGMSPVILNFTNIGEKAGCEHPIKTMAYLDNLKRLGLIEFYENSKMADESQYIPLKEHGNMQDQYKMASFLGEPVYKESTAKATIFGKIFYSTCVKE